jgi:long-chain acyl-CoA synthetase
MSSVTGLLRSASRKNGDGAATIYRDRQRTWREVLDRVSRVAGGLRGLGVDSGARVAVLAMNSDRYLELHFAVPWAGGVFEPLNIRWSAQENAFALRVARARVLLVDDQFLEQGRELLTICDDLQTLVYLGDGQLPAGLVCYERSLVSAEQLPDAGRRGADPYVVFYTSGTTAQSKGVELTHDNALFTALAFASAIPLAQDSAHLHLLGLFHVGGAQPLWYITMVAGTHVIHESFDPRAALGAIAKYRITNTVMVPTMISMLLHQPILEETDLTSVRTCVYGGSPMPRSILDEAIRRLPTWQFHQIYGQTESSGYGTALTWADHRTALTANAELLRSAGSAVPGMEVRIADPDGNDAADRAVGEIMVRGGNVMRGYFGNPDETSRVFSDGWLKTGDAGYLDERGYLYVVDRVKDMIVTGGENVYSVDVERALYEHPAVRECAVIGIPDPLWVEAVHAVVVLEDGTEVTGKELSDHCHGLIAGYKCPKSFEFVAGPLPTTPVGKIRKNVLRDPWWEGQGRHI